MSLSLARALQRKDDLPFAIEEALRPFTQAGRLLQIFAWINAGTQYAQLAEFGYQHVRPELREQLQRRDLQASKRLLQTLFGSMPSTTCQELRMLNVALITDANEFKSAASELATSTLLPTYACQEKSASNEGTLISLILHMWSGELKSARAALRKMFSDLDTSTLFDDCRMISRDDVTLWLMTLTLTASPDEGFDWLHTPEVEIGLNLNPTWRGGIRSFSRGLRDAAAFDCWIDALRLNFFLAPVAGLLVQECLATSAARVLRVRGCCDVRTLVEMTALKVPDSFIEPQELRRRILMHADEERRKFRYDQHQDLFFFENKKSDLELTEELARKIEQEKQTAMLAQTALNFFESFRLNGYRLSSAH